MVYAQKQYKNIQNTYWQILDHSVQWRRKQRCHTDMDDCSPLFQSSALCRSWHVFAVSSAEIWLRLYRRHTFHAAKSFTFLSSEPTGSLLFCILGFLTANVEFDLYNQRLTRKERLGITLGLAWIWSAETNTGLQKGMPDKSINTAIGGKPHLCSTLVYQENEIL